MAAGSANSAYCRRARRGCSSRCDAAPRRPCETGRIHSALSNKEKPGLHRTLIALNPWLRRAALLALLLPVLAFAQGYKVVIHVSDNDPAKWNLALNNARNLQADLGAGTSRSRSSPTARASAC